MTENKKSTSRPAVFVGRDSAATLETEGTSNIVVTFGAEVSLLPDSAQAAILDDVDAQVQRYGAVRWVAGTLADHTEIAAELAAELDRQADADLQARRIQAAKYGRRIEAAATNQKNAVEDYKQHMASTTAGGHK